MEISPIKGSTNSEFNPFIDELEKEIMLPLRMPSFFKDKVTSKKVIRGVRDHYDDSLNYFV